MRIGMVVCSVLCFPACYTSKHNCTRTSSSRGKEGSGFKRKMKVGLICAVGGGQVIRGNSVVMLEVCFLALGWVRLGSWDGENQWVGYVALTFLEYRLWSGLVVGIGIGDRG